MFEPHVYVPTDQDLVELLAGRGMGWEIHNISVHRPGSRPVPHAWRWNRDRVRIMVFVGGHGDQANVEFDPLNDQACAQELVKRLQPLGIVLDGWDLATEAGRRATCEAAADRLRTLPAPEPATAEPPPVGSPAIVTEILTPGTTFPPAFMTAEASPPSAPPSTPDSPATLPPEPAGDSASPQEP